MIGGRPIDAWLLFIANIFKENFTPRKANAFAGYYLH